MGVTILSCECVLKVVLVQRTSHLHLLIYEFKLVITITLHYNWCNLYNFLQVVMRVEHCMMRNLRTKYIIIVQYVSKMGNRGVDDRNFGIGK